MRFSTGVPTRFSTSVGTLAVPTLPGSVRRTRDQRVVHARRAEKRTTTMIRLTERLDKTNGLEGKVDEYYLLVPGDSDEGVITEWDGHKVSESDLLRLRETIDEIVETDE